MFRWTITLIWLSSHSSCWKANRMCFIDDWHWEKLNGSSYCQQSTLLAGLHCDLKVKIAKPSLIECVCWLQEAWNVQRIVGKPHTVYFLQEQNLRHCHSFVKWWIINCCCYVVYMFKVNVKLFWQAYFVRWCYVLASCMENIENKYSIRKVPMIWDTL